MLNQVVLVGRLTRNITINKSEKGVKVADGEKSKMSKKQIIGLVVLSLIAIGGVLFGIYGMNSQNDKIAELKGQVSSANEELAKLDARVDEGDEVVIDDEKIKKCKEMKQITYEIVIINANDRNYNVND